MRICIKIKKYIPMTKNLSNTEISKIIMNYNEGKTPNNISDYLKIPLSTVYRVIKQYKETGKNNRCSKGGDKCSKFTNEEK
jgi:transposase